MKILTITNEVPYPLISGAPIRIYNILLRLAKDHDVYLACFGAMDKQGDDVTHLLGFCREVVTVKRKGLKVVMHLGKVLKSIFHGEPPELRSAFSEELAREIERLAQRVDFDIIQIEHGSMGMYLDALPERLRKRTVWILHDIDFDKFKRIAHIERRIFTKARAWVHSVMMRRWQPEFATRFGLCVTMSEGDRQLLLSTKKDIRVEVSPNGVDTKLCRQLPEEGATAELLFIGNMGYQPNADGAVYFCREILPLIRNGRQDPKLWIVGINPGPSVRRLDGNGVFITGCVPEIISYYKKSKVCVVPLRAGSGTRLKILEAMALGRPVVSTSIGCEGLGAIDGEHILIGDDNKRFAEQVAALLKDDGLRARIASKARSFVVESYDWDVIVRKLLISFTEMTRRERNSQFLKDHPTVETY